MNSAAEGTLVIGGAIKGLLMTLGSLALTGYGVYLLVTHHVVAGLLLIFIGEPILFMIADIATGLLLAVIVVVAGLLGWSLKRHEPETEVPSVWDA